MRPLSELFAHPRQAGLYRLSRALPAKEIEDAAKAAGLVPFHIEGANIEKKAQFFSHAALALHFPDYFGNNWDAFEECLKDLSWIETEHGFVIYFDHVDSFMQHAEKHFDTLLELFTDAVEHWKEQGRALFVLLHGKNTKHLELPAW